MKFKIQLLNDQSSTVTALTEIDVSSRCQNKMKWNLAKLHGKTKKKNPIMDTN